VYTLISASVLALDLVRHPHGAAVADVVDRALALDGGLPAGSDEADRAPARDRLIDLADRAPTISEALHSVTLVAAAGLAPGPVAGVSRALQSALMGRLDDLVAMLRTELSGREGVDAATVDVVVDRVVAAWTASDGDEDDLRVLRERWDDAVAELAPPPPPGTGTSALLDLLEAVARCDRRAWVALDAVHSAQHRGASWSELVHDATRVAVAAGRTVDVARWQLSAVRAAVAAGHARATCAPGAMMSVVGAVQGLCVQDLLPHEVVQDLVAPCRAVLLR
jgi:hypothetical protein